MSSEAVRAQISGVVSDHPVVLFMKGTRRAPQCGFSAKVVQILDGVLREYETVDVLSSPELRDGIKEFSNWPTIPQLFINGQFVGGCDIVTALRESGELEQMLTAPHAPAAPVEVPEIRISEAALNAFKSALGDADGEVLHLKIDSTFQNDLYFGAREPNTIAVESGGITLYLERASARRANGLRIDFIDGENAGFKLDNPNQPPTVKQLTPAEAKALLDRNALELFDVRPEFERALASIPAARALDEAGQKYLLSLDRGAPIAFLCHHGMRSQNAAEQVLGEGFRNVHNVKGGIHAWAETVDPSVPRY
ncbi:MAG TPA: Grx4 family monothiol glutaredoxin [Polyangiaceae bacterium]|jgi:monothiol glutaredoxin|nr:Grx4 family monothiol glutaredoxin [Polyangiaceae bacterium]